eukprot:IDg19632t1
MDMTMADMTVAGRSAADMTVAGRSASAAEKRATVAHHLARVRMAVTTFRSRAVAMVDMAEAVTMTSRITTIVSPVVGFAVDAADEVAVATVVMAVVMAGMAGVAGTNTRSTLRSLSFVGLPYLILSSSVSLSALCCCRCICCNCVYFARRDSDMLAYERCSPCHHLLPDRACLK